VGSVLLYAALWLLLAAVVVVCLTALTEASLAIVPVPRRGLRWSLLTAVVEAIWIAAVLLLLLATRPVGLWVVLCTGVATFAFFSLVLKRLHRTSLSKAMLLTLTTCFLAFVLLMTAFRLTSYFA